MRRPSATLKRGAPPAALPRLRAPFVFAILLLLFLALLVRSIYLQRIDNRFLQEQGSSRYSREIDIPAHRGRIVDRTGEPLAISTPVKSIWAFPGEVKSTPQQMLLLATALETTPQALARKLDDRADFVFLAKQVSPQVADRVAALKITGIHDQNEYRRFYPAGETMSHILGFTGDHDLGQEGIELAQQEWLGGKPGSRRVIINRRGDVVEDVESIRAPRAGRDLALSIDTRLQYLAFRELKSAVETNKAKAGGLVILDVDSGEILALANWPTYNPNARNKGARDKMRNRALTDVFEPGSTMKPFTVASALESGKVRPDTVIDTGPGTYMIGPSIIHDTHAYGALTVEQVIQKSSNIGAAKIALSMPSATLWKTYSDVGFGSAPNTGFPGEVAGRLRPAKTWKPIEQATMAFGHGLSVNLVQLARAYTIFASEGDLKPATLLKGNGAVAGHHVVSATTALAVRHMLEQAVRPGGTAPRAQVPGYRVAGKTGTAYKLEDHRYTKKYVASFVGLAPASNPRLIVAVMIDEPTAGVHFGGEVAAPVFSTVMGTALRTMGIPPDAPGDNVILPPEGSEVREEM